MMRVDSKLARPTIEVHVIGGGGTDGGCRGGGDGFEGAKVEPGLPVFASHELEEGDGELGDRLVPERRLPPPSP